MMQLEFEEVRELDDNDWLAIGARIRQRCREKNLTPEDLAEWLQVGKNHIYKIQRGEANCTLQQIHLLHGFLECSVEYLLYGDTGEKMTAEQEAAIMNLKKSVGALQIAMSNVRRDVDGVFLSFRWE